MLSRPSPAKSILPSLKRFKGAFGSVVKYGMSIRSILIRAASQYSGFLSMVSAAPRSQRERTNGPL